MSDKIRLRTVSDLLKEASKTLRPKKICCEADQSLGWLEAEILLAHAIKKDRSWVVTHSNDCLAPSLMKKFLGFVERRASSEPIAYITGIKDFYGRAFIVNRSTLIPRPDTELFIETLKKRFQNNDTLVIWDVGTGSGAIAITASIEFPNATVIATDICNKTIRTAIKNAKLHNVDHRITFIKGNLLTDDIKKILEEQQTSNPRKNKAKLVILANLPYLPENDRTKLAKDVVDFEPDQALYSGKDGLDLIRTLFTQISEKLNVNPNLILAEFDPPQIKTIKKLAIDTFPIANIAIHRDIAQRDRLIEISIK
jgi:release factor glutamine methyltransferase